MTKENTAIVNALNLPISTKHSIEICNLIRGKSLKKSKALLERVIKKKEAVPFKRFNKDVGHRKGGMGSGRYPVKACQNILNLLSSLESNAQNKGLNTEALYLQTLIPNKASVQWRYGRQRRRTNKSTHITIVAEEREIKKKEGKKPEPAEKKEDDKQPAVKEEKKVEEKKPAVKQEEEKKPEQEVKKEEKKVEEKKSAVKQEEKKKDAKK